MSRAWTVRIEFRGISGPGGDRGVEQAAQLMQAGLSEPVSIEGVACRSGASVRRLDRCLVLQAGMSAARLWRDRAETPRFQDVTMQPAKMTSRNSPNGGIPPSH